MQNNRIVKYLFFLTMLSVTLYAVEGKIKVFVKSSDAIYTSQKITIAVELLSNAFSITNAKIAFPASPKYIVQAPKSAAYLAKEEVEGEDWQMVHYEYELYALHAGKIDISSFPVSFTASMGYGQPTKEFELQSDTVAFEVKAPKGVKPNQFVLVTEAYMLAANVKPKKKKLIVGDAVEVSVTQKAKGVPDILLRSVRYASNGFLRVYEKEPQLQSGLLGEYDVSRTDSFTFVATKEGNVTLPAQQFIWWNTQSKKVELVTLRAFHFEILPDPQIAIDAQKAKQKQYIIYTLIILLLLVLGYFVFAKNIKWYLRERKERYRLSEAGKYALLLNALHQENTSLVYKYFYDWLLSMSSSYSRGGFAMISKIYPSFSDTLKQLEEKMVDDNVIFDTIAFRKELHDFREFLLHKELKNDASLLKQINPN